MAIDFKSFASAHRYRLVWIGSGVIPTEDGPRAPFVPFDASPGWLRGHHGMAHRLVTVEDYALGLASASLADLREHARQRGCEGCGCSKADALACLLDGIAPVPPFEEPAEEPASFVSMTLDLDAMSRNELRALASDMGLPVGGNKEELRARIEAEHVEPFEEE